MEISRIKNIFRLRVVQNSLIAVLVLSVFFVGFNMTATSRQMVSHCYAALGDEPLTREDSKVGERMIYDDVTRIDDANPTSCLPCIPLAGLIGVPCILAGSTIVTAEALALHFRIRMTKLVRKLEKWTADWIVDSMVAAFLSSVQQAELNLIDWWDTFWYYNLYPGMQDMVEQYHMSMAGQVQAIMMAADVAAVNEIRREAMGTQAKDGAITPSEGAIVTATLVGGIDRQRDLAKRMQDQMEKDALIFGLNKRGSPGATHRALAEKSRQDEFERLFCDPDSNGGLMNCTGLPNYRNTDIQTTELMFDKLTLPFYDGPYDEDGDGALDDHDNDGRYDIQEAYEALNNNLIGHPSFDAIPEKVLQSATGQVAFLDRRSYLARYAALRSVPHMIQGWRMPGTRITSSTTENWVRELRESAGVRFGDLSDNPSYRELMHALVIDRFNTGKYALSNLTDENAITREKLVLNSLYLMQLRDYYELLERTGLALAVQVSLIAEEAQKNLPDLASQQSFAN